MTKFSSTQKIFNYVNGYYGNGKPLHYSTHLGYNSLPINIRNNRYRISAMNTYPTSISGRRKFLHHFKQPHLQQQVLYFIINKLSVLSKFNRAIKITRSLIHSIYQLFAPFK